MKRNVTEQIYRACLLVVVLLLTGVAAGCTHRLHASMQPDGWSAQPVVSACRFAPDADLDPATGTPVGKELRQQINDQEDYGSKISGEFLF